MDRLWERFENRYGSLWMDRWAGLPMARVKAEWVDELSGFSANSLRGGFDAVKNNRYPPTLGEFVDACRDAARRSSPEFLALNEPKMSREEARARLAEIRERTGL